MKTRPFKEKAAALRVLLRENGMSIRDFAKQHEVDRQVVADLLYLRTTGHRGKSHAVAVKIGLKPKPKHNLLTQPV